MPFINQEIGFGDFRLYKSAIERLKGVKRRFSKPCNSLIFAFLFYDYVIITPDDTCDNGSLILTHKPYMENVNQNVVLKKETIKASDLRKNDMCIVKNKIYKITAIWFAPTLATIGLQHKFRFILYCEEDKSKIEKIYPADFQLELDANSYVEMEN